MFNKNDIEQIKSKGIAIETIKTQINNFISGFPFIHLHKAATKSSGIKVFEENDFERLVNYYLKTSKKRDILKFVPASGAATRMFNDLIAFRKEFSKEEVDKILKDRGLNSIYNIFYSFKRFAFYHDLKEIMKKDELDTEHCLAVKNYDVILDYLLTDKGLNYANLPKGLLKFHKYETGSRIALEEHLVEGANYCSDENNIVNIHLTVSPEHKERFIRSVKKTKGYFEKKFNVKFNCTFSVQKPSTDTIAVEENNELFRESDGRLLFRPGGHGALIENLNDMKGDIIFVKNIDNIVPDKMKQITFLYKQVLGGYLIELQEKVFRYLAIFEKGNITESLVSEVENFAINDLQIAIKENYMQISLSEKVDYLFNKLNRPMRICGMVKNVGEPGGGPFWTVNSKGETSLQIVEASQINMEDLQQVEILKSATHFNPVDLVCGVRNYKGKLFNLKDYIDFTTGFISVKAKDGRNLKAQELPGLWNGAMANWITVFVEVPIITFNPVKTINDLLRIEHQ